MKLTIHRGIDQIGGCITEIATAKAKIIIDLGHNLPKAHEEQNDEFDSAEAVAKLFDGVNAVFYTHNHSDHIGLFRHVPPTTKM